MTLIMLDGIPPVTSFLNSPTQFRTLPFSNRLPSDELQQVFLVNLVDIAGILYANYNGTVVADAFPANLTD